jgi:hypothetical protein
MKKNKKIIIVLFFFAFLCFFSFFASPVKGITCKYSDGAPLEGFIKDEKTNEGIGRAQIFLLINDKTPQPPQDSTHSQENGYFQYNWPIEESEIILEIKKEGYHTVKLGPLRACKLDIFLSPTNEPTPALTPTPSFCATDDQCPEDWICKGGQCHDPVSLTPTIIEPIYYESYKDITCFDKNNNKGIATALGCIPTDPRELIKWVFPYLLGLGGLSAFALIVFSGIQILTSGGNPEKIQGAKETITSAVTGLLFIILSLFLLKLIGGDILGLPAFLGN